MIHRLDQAAPAARTRSLPPTQPMGRLGRLGGWDLVRLAASGEFHDLFLARAREASPGARGGYAVKVLRTEHQDDPAAIGRLVREATLGRLIANSHLAPVLAAGLDCPPYFIVMPWIEGRTLALRSARGEAIGLSVALWIARQIAEALDSLTSAGWMHGDVKPANVIVSSGGHATLVDLGFAQPTPAGVDSSIRDFAGTVAYVAPERLTSRLRTDVRSDLYSLGVLLYEVLAGRPPFAATTLADLVRAHREDHPTPLRRLAPHVPLPVARLVHRLLAKEPLRRPQTPRELIEALVRLEIETFTDRIEN